MKLDFIYPRLIKGLSLYMVQPNLRTPIIGRHRIHFPSAASSTGFTSLADFA